MIYLSIYKQNVSLQMLNRLHFQRNNLCFWCFIFAHGFSRSDLEQYVGNLQKDSGTHRAVTLKDVEEGAVTLRKVGESLAGLKGETMPNIPQCTPNDINVK